MKSLTTHRQAMAYASVGLVNTAITAVAIFALMHFGVGLYLSNACGYIFGIIFSFVANSIFTFSKSLSLSRLAKFLIASLACWIINIFAIKLFLLAFPTQIYISQLVGMGAYTVSGFFINKLWVMK